MIDLSVLIPARNEEWLGRTVADVLEHSGDTTEVIVVLDGAWPDEPLPQHPRVTVLYHPSAVGQRAATNEAARVARGRYVMKLDAHCSLAPGFDVELVGTADQHAKTILWVPAQKNLHIFDWVCPCGWREYQGPRPQQCPACRGVDLTREIVWKPRKGTTTSAWHFDSTLHFGYWKDRQAQQTQDIEPTLSLLGACWMADRAWYLDGLDGLDERHGSWGQMGTELGCKAWLSGGQVLVNRRTWFAHLFRTRADFSFPYKITHAEQEKAREYSRALWRNGQWPKAKHTLGWLVDKFWPVPGWTEAQRAELNTFTREDMAAIAAAPVPAPRSAKTTAGIVYYSDNRAEWNILTGCRRVLRRNAGDLPIVAVTLGETEDWGADRVILPLERGYLTMARQILAGLLLLDTDLAFFAEHDVLYPAGYFDARPTSAHVYAYAGHTWKVDAATGRALTYDMQQLSGLFADRALLIDHYRRRVERITREGFSRRLGFEPGKPVRHGGLDDIPRETHANAIPLVDIRHGHNLTPSRWSKEQFRNQRYTAGWQDADEIPHWGRTAGRFAEWFAEVTR